VAHTVIDLGEVRPGRDLELDAAPAWSAAHRRLLSLLAVLAVALGALAGGGAVADPPVLTEATIPVDSDDLVYSEGDRYYVVHGGASPAQAALLGPYAVSAYALPEARLLGTWALPMRRVAWIIPLGGGATLLTSEAYSPNGAETVGVDEATGRVLWRWSGAYPLGVSKDHGNVLLWASSGGRDTLVALAPLTGTVRWSYAVPAGGWLSAGYDGDRVTALAVQVPSGRVEIRDPESGEPRAAANLWRPRPPGAQPPDLRMQGDLLLVSIPDQKPGTLIAYGLERLDRRWTAEVDLTRRSLAACGAALCVGGQLRGIRMLDAATGWTRWASERWQYIRQVGPHLFATRFVGAASETAVLDPATGRVQVPLGNWIVAGAEVDGQPIGLRHDPAISRTWFARLDPARGTARVIGVAHDVINDCQVHAGYAVCRRLGGGVGIWRLTTNP
jgi:outer membrane protein assembly factor BamB